MIYACYMRCNVGFWFLSELAVGAGLADSVATALGAGVFLAPDVLDGLLSCCDAAALL
jgi:hypothetical protein